MFPDVELIRAVRSELDTVVEEGVQNIVQLLRNAESGSSSGADAFEAKNRKISQYKRWVHGQKQQGDGSSSEGSGDEVDATSDTTKLAKGEEGGTTRADMDISSGGKLTQQLIAKGLLTTGMMSQLKREWRDKEKKPRKEKS
jgi:hypothetical protein